MADIQFVIGAKDAATPALTKVGSSMERLEKSTKQLSDVSAKSMKSIDVSFSSLVKGAVVFKALDIAAQAAFRAFGSVSSAISKGMDDFDAAAESVRALDQAMELNGGSSEKLVSQYSSLADAIERKTNVAAEDAQGLMKQAAVMGVSNDQIDDMAVAAIGLSEALGVGLDEGLNKVRLATEGNFKAFEKLLPAIKEMKTDEEKLAAVLELSAKGMALSESASQSASGKYEQMEHRLGQLFETLAGVLAPIRELAYEGVTLLADALSNILGPAVEGSATLFETWRPVIIGAIESTVNGIVAGLTMAEVVYNNFGAVVGMAIDSILLSYETYRADTMQLFTVEIPAYASWFGENFFNILETAFSAVSAMVTNHITKIIDTLAALWGFISSAGSTDILGQLGEIAGRSYLEGFENSIGELPNIAQRALTDREKELQASMGATANKIAEEFNTKFAERTVKLGANVGENLSDGIDLALKDKDDDVAKKNKGTGSQTGDAILQAQTGRLLTRGPAEKQANAMVDIARNTKETANAVKDVAAAQHQTSSELAQLKTQLANNPNIVLQGTP